MFVPPPAGVQSPARWGSEDWIEGVFGENSTSISSTHRDFVFRSPSHPFRSRTNPGTDYHKVALPDLFTVMSPFN